MSETNLQPVAAGGRTAPSRVVARAVVARLPGVWLGMLIGLSFIATPVKFQAAGLSLPVALEVGQVTFALFSLVEWGVAWILVLAMLVAWPLHWRHGASLLLCLLVVLQGLWLLPQLDLRVAVIVAGGSVEPSCHHGVYALVEAVKALLLLVLVVAGDRRDPRRSLPCRAEWHRRPRVTNGP